VAKEAPGETRESPTLIADVAVVVVAAVDVVVVVVVAAFSGSSAMVRPEADWDASSDIRFDSFDCVLSGCLLLDRLSDLNMLGRRFDTLFRRPELLSFFFSSDFALCMGGKTLRGFDWDEVTSLCSSLFSVAPSGAIEDMVVVVGTLTFLRDVISFSYHLFT
jgi:hypothetical protein